MLLEVDGVESGYGDAIIVKDADLTVGDDEMVSIIGPNGAGKSTLLKTIVGLLRVRKGRVVFDDEDISNIDPSDTVEEGICYIPQHDNVFPNLSVEENLKMGAWTASNDEFEERAERVYERFPVLDDHRDQSAGTLSGGQQQMLAMGTGLVLDPDLLILDEPSAGLAPSLIDDVFEKVVEINDSGTAILMVEQNARRALRESDRGVVLDQGVDRFEGTGEDLLDDPKVAELYLGTSG